MHKLEVTLLVCRRGAVFLLLPSLSVKQFVFSTLMCVTQCCLD